MHLWRCGDFPWVGKPGVMYSACIDGKRPVIFKLERVEDYAVTKIKITGHNL